ncbi:Hypothetical predicted protein [Lecanosticta acicola]|uniref:Uncharacterized protein n=1 Tax=Lecanosticta acicola TaxID=111012 RepID=A0AAI8YYQ2_9PEZI|nr:Hypothetical predicted protein [Lecanosticta acicola]
MDLPYDCAFDHTQQDGHAATTPAIRVQNSGGSSDFLAGLDLSSIDIGFLDAHFNPNPPLQDSARNAPPGGASLPSPGQDVTAHSSEHDTSISLNHSQTHNRTGMDAEISQLQAWESDKNRMPYNHSATGNVTHVHHEIHVHHHHFIHHRDD